jgi:cell division inhibitor SulA
VVYTVPNVAGVTYKWSYSGTGATITGTTNSVQISFSLTAKSGTLSVTAANGCGTSAARSMTITLVKGAVIPSDTINQAAATIPVTLLEITPGNSQLLIYPNPSLGQANFEFQISNDAHVTLDIVSMSGHRITRIYDADLVAGISQMVLLQQALPTGVYFCVMRWNGKMITEKLVILK